MKLKILPNFIIVGAPKAGTTSRYHYLSEHPQVFMSTPKEVNFFSSKEIIEQGLYYKSHLIEKWSEYLELFKEAGDRKAIGEGSVSYLFYPHTPEKIKEKLADVKIIILLRNPTKRAFSHYLMDYRMGLVSESFEQIIYKKNNSILDKLHYQQYVELGMYYQQVKRYLDTFGNDQVKVFLQEDLRYRQKDVIRDLYRFLDLNDYELQKSGQEHNSFTMPKNKFIHGLYSSIFIRTIASFLFRDTVKEKVKDLLFERKKKPKLEENTRNYLYDIYHDDLKKLEKLIERDLSLWTNKKRKK